MILLLLHASLSKLDVCIVPNAHARQERMSETAVHMGAQCHVLMLC